MVPPCSAVQRSDEYQPFDHELRPLSETGNLPMHTVILTASANRHFQFHREKSFPCERGREPQLCSPCSHRNCLAQFRIIPFRKVQERDRGSLAPRKVQNFWSCCDVTSALCFRGLYRPHLGLRLGYPSAPLCRLNRQVFGCFRFCPERDS